MAKKSSSSLPNTLLRAIVECASGGGIGSSGAISGDEKYSKRRLQQSSKAQRTLVLLVAASLALIYTAHSLFPSNNASGGRVLSPSSIFFGGNKEGNSSLRNKNKDKFKRPNLPITQQEHKQMRREENEGFLSKLFAPSTNHMSEFQHDLEELETSVQTNRNIGIRWVRSDLLPALKEEDERPLLALRQQTVERAKRKFGSQLSSFIKALAFGAAKHPEFFKAKRRASATKMAWKQEYSQLENPQQGPKVDFTKHEYSYPQPLLMEPPEILGAYPILTPLKDIMKRWPQDKIDDPPTPFVESLLHFDYTKADELEAARKFRDAKLPFKLTNVPEVIAAGQKWTDEYLTLGFDTYATAQDRPYPAVQGSCQESSDNYFAFFQAGSWSVDLMGVPPTRNNDFDFGLWAEHAHYADAVGLDPYQPHFYWQSGVDREERHKDYEDWSFISRDLPSFSSPTETFFVFEPESQKGIQCRFGERGVTAATHYDGGRNMVAMMTGAKRYILSPPRECSKLGIVTLRGQSIFRHSMLNFGHLNNMDHTDMPQAEREWLERAGQAGAIDTVLKAGEVLYIPSHWFHYITSLQKSAQCNVRSGIDQEGDEVFGGLSDVTDQCVI